MKTVSLNSKINILDNGIQLEDSHGGLVEFNLDEAYLLAHWLNVYLGGSQ